ncbi:hypothetical protein [Microtetraspora niveoalba]|uniref:hypothetical protein n=1 Tax=Microtetraspora niveoalba TaxID=46175 RepID=UPI0012F9BF9F|nr:hypothetical protein [Microtetraspora niveoalba]
MLRLVRRRSAAGRQSRPGRALVVESVACPALGKVRAECLTAWAQLIEALIAERRPDRPVPPMVGTAAIGAVVHLLATAIEEGRDLSSMSGVLAGTAYRLLPV